MNIDTLSIARDLRATEPPAAQAEAIATAIGRSLSEGAATRAAIDVIVHRMEALEERLAGKIEAARSSTLIWLMGGDHRHRGCDHRGDQAVREDLAKARSNWLLARFFAADYILACALAIVIRLLK